MLLNVFFSVHGISITLMQGKTKVTSKRTINATSLSWVAETVRSNFTSGFGSNFFNINMPVRAVDNLKFTRLFPLGNGENIYACIAPVV